MSTRASIMVRMAERFEMDTANFQSVLQKTIMPSGTSKEHTAAFLMVAHQYGLNPFTKEIHAFEGKGGGVVPVVGVDGWIRLANSNPSFDGVTFAYDDDEKGNPVSCTCTIWRKDREHPTSVTEYLAEVKRNTQPWKMERRMLRHKAFIQCSRIAFGFSGIYDEDEARDIAENGEREAEYAVAEETNVVESVKNKLRGPEPEPVDAPEEEAQASLIPDDENPFMGMGDPA